MSKENKDRVEDNNVERVVFEVRRTTQVPKVSTEKFVFEKHEDGWHVHFAAATHYSLDQLREIVEVMESQPMDSKTIEIEK